jgi:hypothetical protein
MLMLKLLLLLPLSSESYVGAQQCFQVAVAPHFP